MIFSLKIVSIDAMPLLLPDTLLFNPDSISDINEMIQRYYDFDYNIVAAKLVTFMYGGKLMGTCEFKCAIDFRYFIERQICIGNGTYLAINGCGATINGCFLSF